MKALWMLPALLVMGSPVLAEEQAAEQAEAQGVNVNYYVCAVTEVRELTDRGILEITDYARAVEMHAGRFAIDRASGITMAGPFATSDARETRVLSQGTDAEGMSVVWLSNTAYTNLSALHVKSYVKGPTKPFVGMDGHLVIVGECEEGTATR